jgi:predicted  nucleic acid-binding Zn-ribbon protein
MEQNNNQQTNIKEIVFPHEKIITENKIQVSELPDDIKSAISEFKKLKQHLYIYKSKPETLNSKIDNLKELSSEIADEIEDYLVDMEEKQEVIAEKEGKQGEQIKNSSSAINQSKNENGKEKKGIGIAGLFAILLGAAFIGITGYSAFNELKNKD